jgi:hypothetical protein
MAVKRSGWLYRKSSSQDAQAMQDRQAQATIRKINRRLANAQGAQWVDFLMGCRGDVVYGIEGRAVEGAA